MSEDKRNGHNNSNKPEDTRKRNDSNRMAKGLSGCSNSSSPENKDDASPTILRGAQLALLGCDSESLGSADGKELVQLTKSQRMVLLNILNRSLDRCSKHDSTIDKQADIMNVHQALPLMKQMREGDMEWSVNVGFENLSYTITTRRHRPIRSILEAIVSGWYDGICTFFGLGSRDIEKIKVLDNVTGRFLAGKPTLVVGPRRSGTTSLFKILSSRISSKKNCEIAGSQFYSSYSKTEVNPALFAGVFSKVGVCLPQLTVSETVRFCHDMVVSETLHDAYRQNGLAKNMLPEVIEQLIGTFKRFPEFAMHLNGLQDCADNVMDVKKPYGVSSRDRRRALIAENGVMRRPLSFYDQIAYGLDRNTAFELVKLVLRVSKTLNFTSVVSIAHPSSEIFELFDDILVLANGHVMYQGTREDVLPFFESIGFACPPEKDVAEFLEEVTTSMRERFRIPGFSHCVFSDADMALKWKESDNYVEIAKEVRYHCDPSHKRPSKLVQTRFHANSKKYANSPSRELLLLLRRQWIILKRESSDLVISLVLAILIGLQLGTLFTEIPSLDDNGKLNLKGFYFRLGVIFLVMTRSALAPLTSFTKVNRSRQVHINQRDSLLYRPVLLVLTEFIMTLPQYVMIPTIFATIVFFLSNFIGNYEVNVGVRYFVFVSLLIVLNIVTSAIFRAIASFSKTSFGAIAVLWITSMISMVLSGLTILPGDIPEWFIWFYWISPVSWVARAMFVVVFDPELKMLVGEKIFNERLGNPTQVDIWVAFAVLCVSGTMGFLAQAYAYTYLSFPERLKTTRDSAEDEYCFFDKRAATLRCCDETNIEMSPSIGVSPTVRKVTLVFKRLGFSTPRGGRRNVSADILNDISGFALPGEMTVLLSSPESTKNILLDILAGRKCNGKVRGSRYINGRPIDQKYYHRVAGYCGKSNVLSHTQTVMEALKYSALLRQGSEVPYKEKMDIVNSLLDDFELAGIQHFEIGNYNHGGLSREQMKRVSIAIELAANPALLFCEEPTTDSDARLALVAMSCLKRVAARGHTIVCSLQPTTREVFELFDRLLLVSGTQISYFGEIGKSCFFLQSYFECIDGTRPMPNERYNPAIWVLDIVDPKENRVAIDFCVEYSSSSLCQTNFETIQELLSRDLAEAEEIRFSSIFGSTFQRQFLVLAERWCKSYWRSPTTALTNLFRVTIVSLVLGLGLRDVKIVDEFSIYSIMATFNTSIVIYGVLALYGSLDFFFAKRDAYYREKSSKAYHVVPYLSASVVAEVPYAFLSSTALTLSFYFWTDLSMDPFRIASFWLFFWVYFVTESSFGLLMACSLKISEDSYIVSTALSMFGLAYSGFFVATSQYPAFWSFIPYVNVYTYALSALASIQFDCPCVPVNTNHSCIQAFNCSNLCPSIIGCQSYVTLTGETQTAAQHVYDVWGISSTPMYVNCGFLLLYTVFFKVTAGLLLSFKDFSVDR